MPVSPGFQTFVLDQLRRVAPSVHAKRMFGGAGLYVDDVIFALIDDDIVYYKVDDETRPEFVAKGSTPFQPPGMGGASMGYYRLPEDLLEDPDALRRWTDQAIAAARRAKAKGRSSKRRRG